MFTPVIEILKNNFPEAKIDIFAGYTPESAGVLEEGEIINRFFNINFVKNSLFKKLKFIYQLRKERYDLSLFPPGANYFKGGIISFLIGAKVRAGGGASFDEKKHKTDAAVDLLKTIGLKIDHIPAPFINLEKEKEFVDCFLSENNLKNKVLIALHPDCDRYQKFKGFRRWPKEYFIELGRKILNNFPEDFIVLLGGPDEKAACQEIKSKLGEDRRIKLAAGYSLRQETAIIDKCNIFVGSDSGLAHAASTTKTNLIAIFGPTNSQISGPRGPRVHIIEEKCDNPYNINDRRFKRDDRSEPCKCLKKITPERVLEKIKEILQNGQRNAKTI